MDLAVCRVTAGPPARHRLTARLRVRSLFAERRMKLLIYGAVLPAALPSAIASRHIPKADRNCGRFGRCPTLNFP